MGASPRTAAGRPSAGSGVCATSPSPGSRSSPMGPSSPGPRSECRTDCSPTNAARPLPTSSASATWPISCTRWPDASGRALQQRPEAGPRGRTIDARLDQAKFGLAVRSISMSTAPGLKLAYASSISDSTPDPRRNFRPDTDSTRRSSSAVFPIPASPTAPAIDFCPRTAATKSGLTFCVSIDGQGVALMIETRPPGPDNILYWRTVLA